MAEIGQQEIGHLLETLHPLREPPAPDSIMPYLVVVLLGVVLAGAAVLVLIAARRRRGRIHAAAQAELAAARGLSVPERLAVQAMVLRRVARQVGGEPTVKAQGAAWLERLDGIFATQFFTRGAGQVYGAGLYQRAAAVDDVDALDREVLRLIARVRVR